MTNTCVIDTSALIRFYIPDGDLPKEFEQLIHDIERGTIVLIAPELIIAEIGQVIWKKWKQKVVNAQEAQDLLKAILDCPFRILSHREYIVPALAIAQANNLTVYDSLFLAIALRYKAELITVDDILLRNFKKLK